MNEQKVKKLQAPIVSLRDRLSWIRFKVNLGHEIVITYHDAPRYHIGSAPVPDGWRVHRVSSDRLRKEFARLRQDLERGQFDAIVVTFNGRDGLAITLLPESDS